MLPQPPPLLPLVAKELGDGEPPDRLLEPVRPRRDHPRQRRCHLGPQRHLALALVHEVVELPDDLLAALRGVQLERLERWAVVLLEPVARRDAPPGPKDVSRRAKSAG